MLLRVAFFVLMAIALVGFGVVAWVALRPPTPNPSPIAQVTPADPASPAQVNILVAARTLTAGSMLKPEDFVARAVPAPDNSGAIAAESPDAVRTLTGAMTKHPMAAGTPIRDGDVIRQTDHGFMAAALRPGMRAVTIAVDASSGSAGLVWPGDRVDLTLTQTSTDPALPPGRRVSAETILTDVRVIAIDSQLVQGAAPTGGDPHNRTVTLEVKPDDVQRVSVAKRLGILSLSVRAVTPDDTAGGNTTAPGNGQAPKGGSVYARDVSSALSGDPPPPPPPPPQQRTIHVFHGSADPKEFKY